MKTWKNLKEKITDIYITNHEKSQKLQKDWSLSYLTKIYRHLIKICKIKVKKDRNNENLSICG